MDTGDTKDSNLAGDTLVSERGEETEVEVGASNEMGLFLVSLSVKEEVIQKILQKSRAGTGKVI